MAHEALSFTRTQRDLRGGTSNQDFITQLLTLTQGTLALMVNARELLGASRRISTGKMEIFSAVCDLGLAFLPWSERGETLMPENNNCAQEGKPVAPEGASVNTDSMIRNAKSLQSVVKKLEWNEAESPQSDLFLFQGTTLAEAILLSLATEIALKALLSLEQKKDPPHIHDLLKLFEQLEPDTQKLLRAEMPGLARNSGGISFRLWIVA